MNVELDLPACMQYAKLSYQTNHNLRGVTSFIRQSHWSIHSPVNLSWGPMHYEGLRSVDPHIIYMAVNTYLVVATQCAFTRLDIN